MPKGVFMDELKPFIKWAGGKRQLLSQLLVHVPLEYNRYIEPFLGGGAMFLALQPVKAIVADINPEIINAFNVIKDDHKGLMKKLNKMQNTDEFFYKVRKQKAEDLSATARAARFIYLNKTCFNGLYRENSKGEFNVPFARHKNPSFFDQENIEGLNAYLNSAEVEFSCEDYKKILDKAQKGDFIYLDSPYYPLKKNSFTKYFKSDFSDKDHKELAHLFKELDKKGCYVLMSNSNSKVIKEMYKDYTIIEIEARRSINSKGTGRKKEMIEVFIKNY